jgi:hypothetical protein
LLLLLLLSKKVALFRCELAFVSLREQRVKALRKVPSSSSQKSAPYFRALNSARFLLRFRRPWMKTSLLLLLLSSAFWSQHNFIKSLLTPGAHLLVVHGASFLGIAESSRWAGNRLGSSLAQQHGSRFLQQQQQNDTCTESCCQQFIDECGDSNTNPFSGVPFAVQIIMIILLISFSALFSGLTLGLMGLDKTGLEIVMDSDDETNAKYARRIYPIRKQGNLLLCTLLLGNVAVNALLSILLADKAGGKVLGPRRLVYAETSTTQCSTALAF